MHNITFFEVTEPKEAYRFCRKQLADTTIAECQTHDH